MIKIDIIINLLQVDHAATQSANSDDEDLVNVDDDDGVAVMSTDVARGHGGDDGGDDRPPPHESAGGCRGKGTRKPNLGGRKAGRMHTYKETENLGLRKIMDELGPQPIWFEWKDNGTMLPLGDHSAHWANLLGEIVREFPMHFGSWRSILPKRKAGVLEKIGIGMSRSGFVMIPRTWPGVLKMVETGQRAQSYAGRDPKHLLPSEIYVELRDSRVPVSNPDLLRYPYCGRRILVGRGSTSIRGSWPWFIGASSAGTFPMLVGLWREGARTSSMSSCLNAIILPMSMSSKKATSSSRSRLT
ncbi:hypothetical protein Tco_0200877 [Tanacetum coccineum]